MKKTFQMVLDGDLLRRAQGAARMDGLSLAGFIRQLLTVKLKELGL